MATYSPPTQVVILAGGKGTRLMEKTGEMPKPLLKVGNKTLLEHIVDIYSAQGYHDFIIPIGYLKEKVFEWFGGKLEKWSNYEIGEEFSTEFSGREIRYMQGQVRENTFQIVDTGEDTLTGGRLKRIQEYITGPFMLTYGDGVGNVDLGNLVTKHKELKVDVTLAAVHPQPRFGALRILDNGIVESFSEKGDYLSGWINGGFMICEPAIFGRISGDDVNLEQEIFPELAFDLMLGAYQHEGFWACVDTLRDLMALQQLHDEGNIEWLKLFGKIEKYL